MAIESINPASGEVIERYDPYRPDAVDAIVDGAVVPQRAWGRLSTTHRSAAIAPLAEVLRSRLPELAALITLEMGKPIAQARSEIEKCAACVDHYVAHGNLGLEGIEVPTEAAMSGYRHLPLGLILGVMPWNYPFWQVLRFAIPTILAGNGVVLKHASNVSGCALELERVATAAGLPDRLFSTVLLEGGAVLPLIGDDRIAGVSLTGSEEVGRRIGAEAGRALKPAVLELGGSDPLIVRADANIAAAGRAAALGRTLNNGQTCIAAKRFIVDATVYDEFVECAVEEMRQLKVGDPMDPLVELGPMARTDLRDEVHTQVQQTVDAGAGVAIGACVPVGDGAYYPATLLVDVVPGMVGFDEEVFGPAAVAVRAVDDEEAIRLANASRYGLGASIWSEDTDAALELGSRLESGMVFVNGNVRSDPRLPFGGVKASGFGRELGTHGLRAFTNAQTTWVA